MKRLPWRQRKILAYVRAFKRKHSYGPSIREIMEACDISSQSVVAYNVGLLVRRGLLARDEGVARSLRLA